MVMNQNVRIGHLNTYHLCNKLADICALIKKEQIDILGISESRLNKVIDDSVVGIPGYHILRRDPDHPGHTGLLVYIDDNSWNYVQRRRDFECQSVECIWLELKHPKKPSLMIGFLYRNPASTFCWYDEFVNMMDNVNAHGKDTILLGDFNINYFKKNIAWDSTTMLFGLQQLITSATRVTQSTSTLLDHLYTNNVLLIQKSWVSDAAISDHFPIICSLNVKRSKYKKYGHTYFTYRCMKNFDPKNFCYDLMKTPFHEIYNHGDPNRAFQLWHNLFLSVINKHVPIKRKRVRNPTLPPWLTKEIMQAMYQRDTLRKCRDFAAYKRQRNVVKSLVRKAKKLHFQKLVADNKNTASIWKAINTFIKPNRTKPLSSLPSINANSFNQHFLTIADRLSSLNRNDHFQSTTSPLYGFCQEKLGTSPEFIVPLIGVNEVGKYIERLKKSVDPDGISTSLLKTALPYIVDSLTFIYNLCIVKGDFPALWKKAQVTPLPKVKTPKNLDDFRPISVLSLFSKPIEQHIHKHLSLYLDRHDLLHSLQSGFRPKHSCHTALSYLIDDWLCAINASKMVGAVFLDFKKAFDMVNHNLLLDKLAIYFNGPSTMKLFRSFLDNRQQCVRYDSQVSHYGILRMGIPQGSVLGPLLFCLFINDLPLCLADRDISCNMFADDITLSISGNSMDVVSSQLQKSLDSVFSWCKSNHMVLNPSKTKCMVITTRQKHQLHPLTLTLSLQNIPLEKVNLYKILGVSIDNHLDWHAHINMICQKISCNLFLLSKLRYLLDSQACKMFINAHILSHINYASTLWDSCAQVNLKRLNSLYRRASKLSITDNSLSTDEKMKILDILPLHTHLKFNKCVFMKKIIDGQVPSYLSHLFQRSLSKNYLNLLLPQPRIDLFKTSLVYSGTVLWNALPENIKCVKSLSMFKDKLHNVLMPNL